MPVESIFERYGLQVTELDSNVYKVINIDREINTDKLKKDIGNCILIISERKRWEIEDDIYYRISYVYYILTDFDDRQKALELRRRAINEYQAAYLSDFKYQPEQVNSIDTLWSAKELGRK